MTTLQDILSAEDATPEQVSARMVTTDGYPFAVSHHEGEPSLLFSIYTDTRWAVVREQFRLDYASEAEARAAIPALTLPLNPQHLHHRQPPTDTPS